MDRDRGDGERCCDSGGTSDDAETFGRVMTREGNCCRIRSSPDGPRPCSCSSKGDLHTVKSTVSSVKGKRTLTLVCAIIRKSTVGRRKEKCRPTLEEDHDLRDCQSSDSSNHHPYALRVLAQEVRTLVMWKQDIVQGRTRDLVHLLSMAPLVNLLPTATTDQQRSLVSKNL